MSSFVRRFWPHGLALLTTSHKPLDSSAMSITLASAVVSNLSVLAAATETATKSNPILSMLPLVLIFAAMYFLLLRPQRKRQKATASLQSSIVEGDEVILNSGIYGFVSATEDDFLWIEIAEKVEVRVTKGSIARKVSTPTPDKPAE